jgi:hypothetical protein
VATNYAGRLEATQKLPLDIWTEVCFMDEVDYLDIDAIYPGRDIGFALRR